MSFPEERHKGMKMFSNSNTLRGIVQDKINPNIPKNAIFLLLSSWYVAGFYADPEGRAVERISRGGFP